MSNTYIYWSTKFAPNFLLRYTHVNFPMSIRQVVPTAYKLRLGEFVDTYADVGNEHEAYDETLIM